MTDINDLRKLTTPPPTGWNPGMTWDGTTGHITTPPMPAGQEPDDDTWAHVLEKFGLSSEKYMIEGPVRHSAWEVPNHGTQHAYRAQIVEKPERTFEIEDLLDGIYAKKTHHPDPRSGWRTIMLSDQHIGKSAEDGGGSDKIAKRWQESVAKALEDGPFKGINLVFGGDTIEGYVSQHGKNIAGCDLTLTEQIRVASHLVIDTIQQCLQNANRVVVATVPGNHSETTRQANVSMTDSHDLQIVHAAQQAIDLAGLGEAVDFYYPGEATGDVTYEAGNTTYTVAHGHKFRGGPVKGAESWWAGQITNDRPAAAADILLFGHFHEFRAWNFTARRWIMSAPSLEDQSTWFANSTGASSWPGALVFDANNGKPEKIGVV